MSGKHAGTERIVASAPRFGRHRAESIEEPTNTAQLPQIRPRTGKIRQVVVTTSALALIPATGAGAQLVSSAMHVEDKVERAAVEASAPIVVPPAVIEYPSVKVESKPAEVAPPNVPEPKDVQEVTKKSELPPKTAPKPAVPAPAPAPVKVPPKAIVIVPPKPVDPPKPPAPVVPPPVAGYANGAAIAAAALAQLGRRQDCTRLVTNSLAAVGISHHGWPVSYTALGDRISADKAMPGDLIYYVNGGMGLAHIAVYIGNGMAVHGGWNGNQTVTFKSNVGSGPIFIRARAK